MWVKRSGTAACCYLLLAGVLCTGDFPHCPLSTLCHDVPFYPVDKIFRVVSSIQAKGFNVSSLFVDERYSDPGPILPPVVTTYYPPLHQAVGAPPISEGAKFQEPPAPTYGRPSYGSYSKDPPVQTQMASEGIFPQQTYKGSYWQPVEVHPSVTYQKDVFNPLLQGYSPQSQKYEPKSEYETPPPKISGQVPLGTSDGRLNQQTKYGGFHQPAKVDATRQSETGYVRPHDPGHFGAHQDYRPQSKPDSSYHIYPQNAETRYHQPKATSAYQDRDKPDTLYIAHPKEKPIFSSQSRQTIQKPSSSFTEPKYKDFQRSVDGRNPRYQDRGVSKQQQQQRDFSLKSEGIYLHLKLKDGFSSLPAVSIPLSVGYHRPKSYTKREDRVASEAEDLPDAGLEQRGRRSEDVETLCDARTTFVWPRVGLNSKNQWRYIVNVPEKDVRLRQVIRAEVCTSPGGPCSRTASLPLGYHSRCAQKHVAKKMLALDDSGEGTYEDNFFVPSCCVCELVRTVR